MPDAREAFEAEAVKGTKGSPDHEGFFAKVAAFFAQRSSAPGEW